MITPKAVSDGAQLILLLGTGLMCSILLGTAAFSEWVVQQRAGYGIFFGVTVDPKFSETTQGQDIFRSYRKILWGVTCIACVCMFVLIWYRPIPHVSAVWGIPVLLVAVLLSAQVGYIRGHAATLPFAVAQDLVRTAALRVPQRLPAWLRGLFGTAQIVPALAVVVTAIYLHFHLPYHMPVGYEEFSRTIQATPASAALERLLRSMSRAAFILNYRYLLQAAEASAIYCWLAFGFLYRSRMADWVDDEEGNDRFLRQVMIYLAVLQTIYVMQRVFLALVPVWTDRHDFLTPLLWTMFWALLYLGWTVGMGLRLYGLRPHGMVDRTADARWKWGLYYFDRNDPAWIVPGRVGNRHAVNWGNPAVLFPISVAVLSVITLFRMGWPMGTATMQELDVAHTVTNARGARMPGIKLEGGEWGVYRLAMAAVEDPRGDKQDAADALVAFADTEHEVRSRVARVLAAHGLRMDAVERLAKEGAAAAERRTTNTDKDNVTTADWRRQYQMAEAWDALGWVYYNEGRLGDAERYSESAWELGWQSLYMQHVAEIELKYGNREEAEQDFNRATSGLTDYRTLPEIMGMMTRAGMRLRRNVQPPWMSRPLNFDAKVRRIGAGANLFLAYGRPVELRVVSMSMTGTKAVPTERDIATVQNAMQALEMPVEIPDSGPGVVMQRVDLHCTGMQEGHCMLFFIPLAMGSGESVSLLERQGAWRASAVE